MAGAGVDTCAKAGSFTLDLTRAIAVTRIAFIMDPLASLSLKKDSTLAMIRAAERRGWNVSVAGQEDLLLQGGRILLHATPLRLNPDFAEALDPAVAAALAAQGQGWHRLGDTARIGADEFDIIMMRKDPPFDMAYIYTTYLLERAEDAGVLVVNRPASLRDCNEKFFATLFPDCCPPLIVSRRYDELRAFQQEHGNVVFKRLDGMGGASVFRVMSGDPNLGVILEVLTSGGQEQIMGQVFLPEIADGDKRILMVDGAPVPHALARIPKAGEGRGNLAVGGIGESRPLTARDREIASRVGPELVKRGLTFAGLDVIGDYLTEINITCPTCIRELDASCSLDIAGNLLDALADKLD